MAVQELSTDDASELLDDVIDEISGAVIVERSFLETVLVGILARGHVLLEDVPGTGKTLTAQSFATALGLEFSRIQFTPDLLPNDVTGTHIFNEKDRSFEFNEGPIFSNIVLADEINRAPPKTQAAMLEAMAERQVTVEGETRKLPEPFFVMATQNPVEQEGTFPLPEAQVDRFAIKSSLGYPDIDGEKELLRRRAGRTEMVPSVSQVLQKGDAQALQQVPERVTVDEDMISYIAEITQATRNHHQVRVGISPRGTQRLFEASRAMAVINDRDYVTPDDVKGIALASQSHRLVLTAEAQVNDVQKRDVMSEIIDEVPVPTVE